MTDYINPIPQQNEKPLEVSGNEQRTPKRITTEYKTTGNFEDISKKSEEDTRPDIPR